MIPITEMNHEMFYRVACTTLEEMKILSFAIPRKATSELSNQKYIYSQCHCKLSSHPASRVELQAWGRERAKRLIKCSRSCHSSFLRSQKLTFQSAISSSTMNCWRAASAFASFVWVSPAERKRERKSTCLTIISIQTFAWYHPSTTYSTQSSEPCQFGGTDVT